MAEDTFEVALPSTLRIEAKPWSSTELVKLGAAARGARGSGGGLAPMFDMLSRAWVRTLDPGPYDLPVGDARPERPWRNMLVGDVLVGLKEVRARSSGDLYYLPFECPRCGEDDRIVAVPLSELGTRPLSDEARAKVKNREPFTAHVAGVDVSFDLQYGRHDEEAAALLAQVKADRHLSRAVVGRSAHSLIEAAAVRVRALDGRERPALERWEWVASLRLEDVDDLRDAFDAHDCGVETDHEVLCESCQRRSRVDVPLLTGRWFWQRPDSKTLARCSSSTSGDGWSRRPGGGERSGGAPTTEPSS
jgi:hypothetical protein